MAQAVLEVQVALHTGQALEVLEVRRVRCIDLDRVDQEVRCTDQALEVLGVRRADLLDLEVLEVRRTGLRDPEVLGVR